MDFHVTSTSLLLYPVLKVKTILKSSWTWMCDEPQAISMHCKESSMAQYKKNRYQTISQSVNQKVKNSFGYHKCSTKSEAKSLTIKIVNSKITKKQLKYQG